MKVRVYWNFHRKCYSVQEYFKDKHGWRISKYSDKILLTDAVFKVIQAGRAKVIKNKCKNVHAYIIGTEVEHLFLRGRQEVSYNPYTHREFLVYEGTDSQAVHSSKTAVLEVQTSVAGIKKPRIRVEI